MSVGTTKCTTNNSSCWLLHKYFKFLYETILVLYFSLMEYKNGLKISLVFNVLHEILFVIALFSLKIFSFIWTLSIIKIIANPFIICCSKLYLSSVIPTFVYIYKLIIRSKKQKTNDRVNVSIRGKIIIHMHGIRCWQFQIENKTSLSSCWNPIFLNKHVTIRIA